MIRRPPRSTLFPYTNALPICQRFEASRKGFDEQIDELLCAAAKKLVDRSEEHTSELQSRLHLVCRLLLENKTSAQLRLPPPGPLLPLQDQHIPLRQPIGEIVA